MILKLQTLPQLEPPLCELESGARVPLVLPHLHASRPFMRLPRALQRGREVEDRSSNFTGTVIARHWDSLCLADSKCVVFLMVAFVGSSEIPKPWSSLTFSAIKEGVSETEIPPNIHLPLLII